MSQTERIDLEKIIDLRNMSTHFITEEYGQIYVPLFQSCVLNYSNKHFDFFRIDISTYVPQNFLTLSINLNSLTEDSIKARYPEQIAEKILNAVKDINYLSSQNGPNFSISIVHDLHLTKNPKNATTEFRIVSSAEEAAHIIKDIRDPTETHKYTTKKCIEAINKRIIKNKVNFKSNNKYSSKENLFNMHHFGLFTSFYDMKRDIKYCYVYGVGTQPQYSYSQSAIDFIYAEIAKDPEHIIQSLKNAIKQKES